MSACVHVIVVELDLQTLLTLRLVYHPSVMMPAPFKRALSGDAFSPKPKVRKTDPETPAKEGSSSTPPMLHGVKRAVQPPSRGEQSKIWRFVTDIYPPEFKTDENRNGKGKPVLSFKCQCLLPKCGDSQFWQRHRENRRVYDHLSHWHNISRTDMDNATDDWINELFKNGKEPGKDPVTLKPLAPVGDGKPQAVLMRTIPRGSERHRKMLRAYAVMLVKSGMGISPQMPAWLKHFLRQYSIQTSAPHVWVHAPRRSLRAIYSNDIVEMNNRIDALLGAVPPHERVEHIDEWEGPRPLRPCFLGCTVSMLHPKTWAPLSILLSVSNLGHFTIDDMTQKEARTLVRCYHASWDAQRAQFPKSNAMMIDNTAVNPAVCRSLGVVAMRCSNHILEIAVTRLFFPCNMSAIQQRGAHPRPATKHNLCQEVVVAHERLRACCVALARGEVAAVWENQRYGGTHNRKLTIDSSADWNSTLAMDSAAVAMQCKLEDFWNKYAVKFALPSWLSKTDMRYIIESVPLLEQHESSMAVLQEDGARAAQVVPVYHVMKQALGSAPDDSAATAMIKRSWLIELEGAKRRHFDAPLRKDAESMVSMIRC